MPHRPFIVSKSDDGGHDAASNSAPFGISAVSLSAVTLPLVFDISMRAGTDVPGISRSSISGDWLSFDFGGGAVAR